MNNEQPFENVSLPRELQVWTHSFGGKKKEFVLETQWIIIQEDAGKSKVWNMECSTDSSIFYYMHNVSTIKKWKKNLTGNFVHMFKIELQNLFIFL